MTKVHNYYSSKRLVIHSSKNKIASLTGEDSLTTSHTKVFSSYHSTNNYTTEINENVNFCSRNYHSKYLQYGYVLYLVYLAEAGMVMGQGVSLINGSSSGSSNRS